MPFFVNTNAVPELISLSWEKCKKDEKYSSQYFTQNLKFEHTPTQRKWEKKKRTSSY